MTTPREPQRAACQLCGQRHEECATGRQCDRWRMSWEVAALFGELPYTIPPSLSAEAGGHGE